MDFSDGAIVAKGHHLLCAVLFWVLSKARRVARVPESKTLITYSESMITTDPAENMPILNTRREDAYQQIWCTQALSI